MDEGAREGGQADVLSREGRSTLTQSVCERARPDGGVAAATGRCLRSKHAPPDPQRPTDAPPWLMRALRVSFHGANEKAVNTQSFPHLGSGGGEGLA